MTMAHHLRMACLLQQTQTSGLGHLFIDKGERQPEERDTHGLAHSAPLSKIG